MHLKFQIFQTRKTSKRPQTIQNSDQSSNDEHNEFRFTKRKPKSIDPADLIRLDNFGHLPDHIETKARCRVCQSQVRTRCIKCNVHLCLTKEKNCYKQYHIK